MEDVLVPLMFFAGLFGFPLARRALMHRHAMERLRAEQAARSVPTLPETATLAGDPAPALALRLPEPHRLYALALLCRLEDAPLHTLDPQSAYLVRQARTEYLPDTLRAYLNLTPGARAELRAGGHDPEALLRRQLELVAQGIEDALRRDPASAARLLTQGHFLGEVFPARETARRGEPGRG